MNISIEMGCLAEPVSLQMQRAGVRLLNPGIHDACHKALSTLWVHGALTDAQRQGIAKKLVKAIMRDVRPLPAPHLKESV